MQLVNGYECYIDKAFIAISPPESEALHGDAISDVGEFDQVGDVLFGTRVDRDYVVIGYFIINTLTHEVQLIGDHQEWIEKLDGMGITERNVRWPGVFFHGFGIVHTVALVLLILVPTYLMFLIVRGLARYELELRQRKIDRR